MLTVGRQPDHAAHYLVRAAVTAPSLHNSQPWRFVSRDGEIDMYADAGRLLGVCDPDGREMLIGCGAALFNLRLAMRHLGFLPVVRQCPDPGRPGLLARVGWGAYARPTPDEERMFGALPHRHTHRGPFDPGPLPPALLNVLARHARQEGTELFSLYDAEDENRLAELIRTAETFQRDDPGFATELAGWTVSPDEGRRDGVPAQYRPWRPEDLLFAERDFPHQPPKSHHGSSRRVPAPNSLGLVALLNTRQDGPRDWLRAGQALQRVLLLAAGHQVTAAFHTQPLELPDLRAQVRNKIITGQYPQIIMRLGRTGRTTSSPRRPAGEVLTTGSRPADRVRVARTGDHRPLGAGAAPP